MEVTEHLFAYIRNRELQQEFYRILFGCTIGTIAGTLFAIGVMISMHHK